MTHLWMELSASSSVVQYWFSLTLNIHLLYQKEREMVDFKEGRKQLKSERENKSNFLLQLQIKQIPHSHPKIILTLI